MQEGDIDFAIYQMTARHFRLPLKLTPVAEERAPFVPKPDEDVYIVQDDMEQRLALIKVYTAADEEEEEKVADMINGVRVISSLGLKECEAATPIDFEQAKVEAVFKQFVALFTIPEGRTLLQHILYLARQGDSPLERRQALDILKNGYRRLAAAFAELHTKRFSPICTIDEYYWKFHMEVCQALVKSLRTYEENVPLNLTEFSDNLIKMAVNAYAKPCSAGFLHGNALAGSIAYEPFSETLSLMDLESSYHSIDKRGMPCGPSAYDFVWAEASLELQMAFAGLPYDELCEVRDDYRQTYKEAMRGRYPQEHHLTFYSVLFWLPIYKTLVITYDGSEKGMSKAERRVFNLAFSKVELVMKFSGIRQPKPAV